MGGDEGEHGEVAEEQDRVHVLVEAVPAALVPGDPVGERLLGVRGAHGDGEDERGDDEGDVEEEVEAGAAAVEDMGVAENALEAQDAAPGRVVAAVGRPEAWAAKG